MCVVQFITILKKIPCSPMVQTIKTRIFILQKYETLREQHPKNIHNNFILLCISDVIK